MLPLAVLAVLALLAAAALVPRRRRRRPVEPEPLPVVEDRPVRRELVLTEAVPPPATISGDVVPPRPFVPLPRRAAAPDAALDVLDALLEELESTTVRIDGADALDESAVAELEGLATRLEAAAESLACAR